MADGALSDIKVIDLTYHIAGPYCTKLLADYGAEVIKIERPDGGDVTRSMGPFPGDIPHPEKSGTFLHLNTNKKGITLNLETATGLEILKKLVKDADILVENYSPTVAQSLGVTYEAMEKVNPQLVMTSITPFGQTGPYRDYSAPDIVAYAMSGRIYRVGLPEREPVRHAPYLPSYLAGVTAAGAAVACLWQRYQEGAGQQVDVSIQETFLGAVDTRFIYYTMTGTVEYRLGARRPGTYPSAVYPCKDGFFHISSTSQRHWARLCRAIGMPLLDDPRFATPAARREHEEDFDLIWYPWCLERTKREIFHIMQAERVWCAPVYTVDELFSDDQYMARNYFVDVEHPSAGKLTYTGAPFIMHETPWQIRSPAPLLGQHNEEVLAGKLGHSKEDLGRLRERGII